MKRYHIVSCHVLWRELCHFASSAECVYDFTFLPQGLHNTPPKLREDLQAAIDAVDNRADAVLIGYGLCSRGIDGIVARDKPLVVMRGHDCITFLLGSKEKYQEYFNTHPGTYWYSPGWIDTNTQPSQARYDTVRQQYAEQYGEENADYLMQSCENWYNEYSHATYIELGIGNEDYYKNYTLECARWLNWQTTIVQGQPELLIDFLTGRWDDERFLVVKPGQKIIATMDDKIIGAADA